MSESQKNPNGTPSSETGASITLAILGCGSLGTALLCGILTHIEESKKANSACPASNQPHVPNKFMACVRTAASAAQLELSLAAYDTEVAIYHGDQRAPLHEADVIVLACQPGDLRSCLATTIIRSQLQDKVLVSLLAGVTIPDIESVLQSVGGKSYYPATIARAMPNTASFVRESITVIETPEATSASHLLAINWLFESIGKIKHISAANFDTCTALGASTPAFFAIILDALIDGAVTLGLTRKDATLMAAQSMKGCAALVLAGEHPASVKENITTPGGSTIMGVLALEQGNVRAVVAGALIKCKEAAEGLGAQARN
ncbi:putative pyrroline-5-carboxylate reductase protein [Botrytis cinerea BcDW1]|uniref:Pyrroline-5-carboxylate reductase n=1 Tax=Botryotinia fuckeliana (strain BcDW1) TaxID=1290391 RepID=M7TQG1_BOTF1|nr:putative pyrroline-5-carboxylate reductase protein [Botrytis cinerea BcDW1]